MTFTFKESSDGTALFLVIDNNSANALRRWAEIAKSQYLADAESAEQLRVAEQFERQAAECDELLAEFDNWGR